MLRLVSNIVGILIASAIPALATADHAVVLVARADSAVDTIDPLDVRKIYLGFSVRNDKNIPLRAATNESDSVLYEIFLQDVMAMSAKTYDRRLLTLTLQTGRRRPDIFQNNSELIKAMTLDPDLITFMWLEDYEKASNLKVIRVIWQH